MQLLFCPNFITFIKKGIVLAWQDYITTDPEILHRKPTIKGTHIPVDLILEKLAYGENVAQLLEAYPRINQEKIYACYRFVNV